MKLKRPPVRKPVELTLADLETQTDTPVEVPRETCNGIPLPQGWHKGMLLNVRNVGEGYRVTLYPEEYDPRAPERTLLFRNPGEAQNFVSHWYARESADPRAR